MAIIFTTPIDNQELHFSYNNKFIEFYDDAFLTTTKNCNIKFTNLVTNEFFTLRYFPNPLGNFKINLKTIVNILLNKYNYVDDIDYNVNLVNYANKILLTLRLDFEILNSLDIQKTQSEIPFIYFIDAYQSKYESLNISRIFLLHPRKEIINNENINNNTNIFLKKWVGYPFDVTFKSFFENYGNNNNYEINFIEQTGFTNIFAGTNYNSSEIDRIIFSNGNTENSNLPLEFENKKISVFNDSDDGINYFIMDSEIPCSNDGHYIKWLNQFGGWSYWLFNKADIKRSVKSLGEIQNNNNNLQYTTSKTHHIGYKSNDYLTVYQTVQCKYQDTFSDLFESLKIYLYEGNIGQVATYLDWIEVKIKDKSNLIQDKRFKEIKYEIEIEIPNRDTRTI